MGRSGHTAVYDAANDRMIIFGGTSNTLTPSYQSDTWVLSNASGASGRPSWIQLAPTNPPPGRSAHTAVYDPNTNEMIVFGGSICGGPNATNDEWILTNANGLGGTPAWTLVRPVTVPPAPLPRFGRIAVYDSPSDTMVIWGGFGGVAGGNQTYLTDTRRLTNASNLSGGTWRIIADNTPSPPGRINAVAGYDQTNQRLIMYGGGGSGNFSDTWVQDNILGDHTQQKWKQVGAIALAPTRNGAAGVYVSDRNQLFAFGGSAYCASPSICTMGVGGRRRFV